MEKINRLVKLFDQFNIDAYIIPKNDEFFNEYISENNDKLKFISNFSGSFGLALISKKKIIYLLMDDIPYKQKSKAENYLKLIQCQKVYPQLF